MKTRKRRVLSIILAVALVLSFIPVTDINTDTAKAATKVSNEKYQPKHKLAKAVEIMNKAEDGKLKVAVEEITGTGEYYESLPDDEKAIYIAIGQVYNSFRPYASSNEFYDKAKGAKRVYDALSDDIENGKVAYIDFGATTSKEEFQNMFSMASTAYRFDHPYNLLWCMYKISYFRVNNSQMYMALCHIDNTEDFDYRQWGQSLVQFEKDALSKIVYDARFSQTSAPIKEYLVHDYICSRVKYDASKPPAYTLQWSKIKSAYGPMVENQGVCIGIAYMAKILMDDLEVSNYIVHSGTHAWNMVYLDGGYYELDCTWDLDSGKGVEYKYFNRTTDEILSLDTSGAHVRAADEARIPWATGTTYTYDYICQLLKISKPVDQDSVKNPSYSSDDNVDDIEGEIVPNEENFEYEGLLYDLFSEGYAVCKGAVGNPKTIKIPDNVILADEDGEEVYYQVVMVDYEAFMGRKALKKVTLPGTLVYIGDDAFYRCSNLNSITINSVEDLYEIDNDAFKSIGKKPTFYIYADPDEFNEVKALIKAAGAPKKSKFKRLDV